MPIEDVRSLFPIAERYTYLNTTAVSPLPLPVSRAVSDHVERLTHSPFDLEMASVEAMEAEVRERAARLVNAARADELVQVAGTATGINIAARSLPLGPGDNVLVVDGDYPAVVYPWMAMASRGVLTKLVPAPWGGLDLDLLGSRIDARTRVICVSTVMFTTGFHNDMAAIGALCRDRGIYFVVDAIQSLGALPIDVQGWGIDMLAAGSHKWLLSGGGTGLFYCRHELLEELDPTGPYVGAFSVPDLWNFLDYNLTPRDTSGRFATSAWNSTGTAALRAALELMESAGPATIAERVLHLARIAMDDVRARGYRLVSPDEEGRRSGIVVFEVPDPQGAYERLLAEGIVTAARGAGLRISANFWNTEEEVLRVGATLGDA